LKEKYLRWTLAQRANLAATVAASDFHTFCDPDMRGPNWTPQYMLELIASNAKKQAVLGNMNPKYHEHTAKMAVDFYTRYLAQAMKE
jgi:phosphoribosyl 1,2-cyclic phosphodiesterase